MPSLKDQVVMITGASSGFGEHTARILGEKGAKVVLGARREDKLKEICGEIGKNAVYSVCDVSKVADVQALAKKGIDSFGHIDSLVNNAGIMPLSLISKGRVEEWDRMIDVNIKGVLYGIHSVFNHMMERGSGTIINISSIAGLRVNPSVAVYSGTKYAVRAISDGLRQEAGGKVRVCCIYPGAFITELINSVKDESVIKMFQDRGFAAVAGDAKGVADAIVHVLEQPAELSLSEVVVRPTAQTM